MPYSTLLFTGALPTSSETIYTVPAQFVAVVRDIELLNYSGATATVNISATIPGPLAAIIWYSGSVLSGESTQWRGRVVLPAGTTIQALITEADNVTTMSGYLLSA